MNLKNKLTSAIGRAAAQAISARVAGVLFASVATVVAVNEGYKEVAYQDSGGVWTICYGETEGVKRGDVRDKLYCDAQLKESINKHAAGLVGLPDGLPDAVVIGALDQTYNIGVYGFKSSSMYKALLLRDYTAAGQAVLKWRYITVKGQKYDCSQLVGGKPNKVCYGLWERRLWQSKAIGNQFKSAEEAVQALPR